MPSITSLISTGRPAAEDSWQASTRAAALARMRLTARRGDGNFVHLYLSVMRMSSGTDGRLGLPLSVLYDSSF